LLHQPDVLILDEPGTGLDPVQTENLRALLRERAAAGTAIVLSTHLLAEVTALCTRAAILHQGELRHDAPLHASAAAWRVTLGAKQVEPARAALTALAATIEIEDTQHLRVQLRSDADAALLARTLVGANLALLGLEPATPPLARVFMDIAASRSERAA
jgi:ABC-2 type transport system ATP-binding protein